MVFKTANSILSDIEAMYMRRKGQFHHERSQSKIKLKPCISYLKLHQNL